MSSVPDVYADVGRSAAGIALRFVRIRQNRETQRDRDALGAIVDALTQISDGEVKLQSEYPLFSTIDGVFVLVSVVNEWAQLLAGNNTRERLKELSRRITELMMSEDKDWCSARAAFLQDVFREAHDFAQEITVTGLKRNPVSEVYSALA